MSTPEDLVQSILSGLAEIQGLSELNSYQEKLKEIDNLVWQVVDAIRETMISGIAYSIER